MKTFISRKRGWRYWRNLALFALGCSIVGLLVIQYVGIPIFLAYGYSHPQRLAVCCYTPVDLGWTYEDVAVVTRDNLTLRGWYIPSHNRAAVLLLHPEASNRLGTIDGAKLLVKHGYGVLLLDIRAHGESDGQVLPFGGPEIEDVRAAVSYLQTRSDVDAERLGVMGWSLGAQVGLLGAARVKDVKAVVADGPGATAREDWPPPHTLGEWFYVPFDFVFYHVQPFYTGVTEPLSIKSAVAQIAPRPLLLISAGQEYEEHRVRYFYNAASEPKSLWGIPEATHIDGLSKRPEEYEEKVVEFFDAALLGSNP